MKTLNLPLKYAPPQGAFGHSIVDANGGYVANTSHHPDRKAEAEDYAHQLINAANNHDSLLSALTALFEAIDSCTDLTPEVMRQAQSAIEKAKGGKQ